jgi:hypothetical protein
LPSAAPWYESPVVPAQGKLASAAPALAALAFTLALSGAATAEDPPAVSAADYRFSFDPRMRAEANAVTITSVARLLLRGEDELLALLPPARRTSPLAVAERLTAFVLVDLPIASYELVLPHEIFGHGTRYREFGTRPSYHIGLPLPFDLTPDHHVDPGAASRPLYTDESMLVDLGGLETQATQQRALAFTTFRGGVLGRGEAVLYVGNALTKIAQTIGARDLDAVAFEMASRYGVDATRYRRALRFGALGEAVDPLLWVAIYAAGYRYLWRGDREVPFPVLRLGGVPTWLTTRVLLVPWGVEPHVDALARLGPVDVDVALRPGLGPGGASFGFQVDAAGLRVLRVLRLGAGVAGWLQPGMQSAAEIGVPRPSVILFDFGSGAGVPPRPVPRRVLGGAAHLDLEVRQGAWFLGTRLGVKSVGLLVDAPIASDVEVLWSGGVRL